MKTLRILLLLTILTASISACKKKDTTPDTNPPATNTTTTTPTQTTSVTAPCSPAKNTSQFTGTVNYTSVGTGTVNVTWGGYGISGSGSQGDMDIEFASAPVTGKYKTVQVTSFLQPNECIVRGVWGGTLSYAFYADPGDTVYVTKLGTDKYSATFCNAGFASGQTSLTFHSDGNLTYP